MLNDMGEMNPNPVILGYHGDQVYDFMTGTSHLEIGDDQHQKVEGIETFCTGLVQPIIDRNGTLSSASSEDSSYMSDQTYTLNTFVQLGTVSCYKRGSA